MRSRFSKAAFAGAAIFLGSIGYAQAEGTTVDVQMNQAKIVKLARAADTVVVGNPLIADASVQDSNTLILTGKGFGTTNLVVLDQQGAAIVDAQVTVSRNDASSVRIYRRAQVQTLSCTPLCEGSFKSEAERGSEQEISAQ